MAGLNYIAKWNGTAWSALDKGLNNGVIGVKIGGANVYVCGSFTDVGTGGTAVTGLNKITIVLNQIVLPVELLSVEGKNTEGGNILYWTTANEVNNKGFDIERQSADGNWSKLGFIAANGKASNYQFTDDRRDAMHRVSTTKTDYYRLRQVDNDGKETLSKVIAIQTKGNSKLKAYPNPVSTVLTIETDATGDYQIMNFLGQEISHGKIAKNIDISVLPQGAYFLKVGEETVKFIKQ